jgi:ssDNA-binding Zn-finger/Zn-ribbon topoisomerase 1
MRKYNPQTHECSKCGTLMTKEYFRYHAFHEKSICEARELKNMALKTEIEKKEDK